MSAVDLQVAYQSILSEASHSAFQFSSFLLPSIVPHWPFSPAAVIGSSILDSLSYFFFWDLSRSTLQNDIDGKEGNHLGTQIKVDPLQGFDCMGKKYT